MGEEGKGPTQSRRATLLSVLSLALWFLSWFGHLMWVRWVLVLANTGYQEPTCLSGCCGDLAFAQNIAGALAGYLAIHQARRKRFLTFVPLGLNLLFVAAVIVFFGGSFLYSLITGTL